MEPATLGSGEMEPVPLGSDETEPVPPWSGEMEPAPLGSNEAGPLEEKGLLGLHHPLPSCVGPTGPVDDDGDGSTSWPHLPLAPHTGVTLSRPGK
jgi:hypothetical protein